MTQPHNSYEIVPLRRHIEKTTNGTTATQVEEDENTLKVTRIETISTGAIDLEKVGFVDSAENLRQFALRDGDILFSHINSMSVIGNSAAVTKDVLPLYVGMNLLRLRPSADACPAFLAWCLKSDFVRHQVRQFAKPAINQASISTTNLKRVRAPLPDLPTQRAIADFLDRETARIDLLIEKKQRLVALLGEKYFAELESVTFPVNTQTDELVPFRWVCRIVEGQVDPTSETWRKRILIAPNHIEKKTGRLLPTDTAEDQGAISGKYAFDEGTVLYSKIRPALAKACLSPSVGMCSADMYPIVPDKRLRSEYLLMQLLSARFTDWATLESMRVAMPKINRETLGGFHLRVPQLAVQDQYIAFFAKKRSQFEQATDKINVSISRLTEYRSALITAAVTGQIDVTTYAKSGTPDRRLDAIQEEMGT